MKAAVVVEQKASTSNMNAESVLPINALLRTLPLIIELGFYLCRCSAQPLHAVFWIAPSHFAGCLHQQLTSENLSRETRERIVLVSHVKMAL